MLERLRTKVRSTPILKFHFIFHILQFFNIYYTGIVKVLITAVNYEYRKKRKSRHNLYHYVLFNRVLWMMIIIDYCDVYTLGTLNRISICLTSLSLRFRPDLAFFVLCQFRQTIQLPVEDLPDHPKPESAAS